MSRIAVLSFFWRSFKSSRTCACTVTSRAVVGSSAMMSFGCPQTAIAMMTRWHMPPESSCGYASIRFSASGMPTSFNASTALFQASFLLIFSCSRIISTIWWPILNTGSKEVIGFWKIMQHSSPRNFSIWDSERLRISTPSKMMEPSTIFPVFAGMSRITEALVTLFPEPDSPTIPMVVPSFSVKLTPSTALETPLAW